MSFLAGFLNAISYMKEIAELDHSMRRAVKRKAINMEYVQGATLCEILLRGWVRGER